MASANLSVDPDNRKCSFDGCENNRGYKNWCPAHYQQWKRGNGMTPLYQKQRKKGSPPVVRYVEELSSISGVVGPCHTFIGSVSSDGYCHVRVNGVQVKTHRYTYELKNGPIPEGLVIDHMCRNRKCCNADHLRAVTRYVNSTENVIGSASALCAAKTHCLNGHPFDEKNTVYKQGSRQCRECIKVRAKNYRKKIRDSKLIDGKLPFKARKKMKLKPMCVNGHLFDEKNTYIHSTKGTRECRRCRADRESNRNRRLRECE